MRKKDRSKGWEDDENELQMVRYRKCIFSLFFLRRANTLNINYLEIGGYACNNKYCYFEY